MSSSAFAAFQTAIGHPERLMQGTKQGKGKPTAQETSMFVAAVVLTYAAWEGYVEDLAVEVTRHLAKDTRPENVPATARKAIEAMQPSQWEYSVHPGWRGLWTRCVTEYAKGTEGDNPPFGMNTANAKNTIALFQRVGVDVWGALEEADKSGIESLVRLRGEVAHTGGTPTNFKKGLAQEHLARVKRVVELIDQVAQLKTHALTGTHPWP
jgi:hypothetical protein